MPKAKKKKGWDDRMLKNWFGLKTPQVIGKGYQVSKQNRENCKWRPPNIGWFKLNFDGASRGNSGPSGAGGVIHSWQGKTIARYSKPLEIDTNNMAEFKALVLGLSLCIELNLAKVEIEGDSAIVVNALRAKKVLSWKLQSLLDSAINMMDKFENVMINHIYREGNTMADALANLGANGMILKQITP